MTKILDKKISVFYIAFLAVILSIFTYSCDGGNGSGHNNNGGGSGIAYATPIISDANGVVIGKAVLISGEKITIYSSDGYLFNLGWNGKIIINQVSVFFTELDCTGLPYIEQGDMPGDYSSGKPVYLKQPVYSQTLNKYYRAKSTNSEGLIVTTSPVLRKSYAHKNGNIVNNTYTINGKRKINPILK